jgi:transmembrane sensor
MTTEPSRYVQPEVSEARVERLWSSVNQRLDARPRRTWRWVALCGAVAVAGGAAFFLTSSTVAPDASAHRAALPADAKLETENEPLAVKLSDDSEIALAPRSGLEVRGSKSAALSLVLSRGAVTCDVAHREGRTFSVLAGDVVVRVVGTKFTVKTSAGELPRVEVSVLRGVVEVESKRRPGVVAKVAAGQSWIQSAEPDARGPASPEPAAASMEPADGARLPDVPVPSASAVPLAPSARELFEKAGERRRAGEAAAAARSYEELLKLHPGDPRASLAAFELGRLRMDRLRDPAGAIAALERAVASNLGPSFREDALARLVSVYAAQGNFAACGRARERYLKSYPAGVHAAAVQTRCGSR